MTTSPDMRAGDEDRDRTIGVIREAFAEGRLSNDEFQDRLSKAQDSRTFGELAALTVDLPSLPPIKKSATAQPSATSPYERDWRKAWLTWLGVSVLVNGIWAISWVTNRDEIPYYWPMWVMVPWGLAMAAGWLTQRWR